MERTEFILDYQSMPTKVKQLNTILKDDRLRLRIYQYMLAELDKRLDHGMAIGMCHCCPPFIGNVEDDLISYRLKVLPELWKRKPKFHSEKFGSYWFEERDYHSRERLLTVIIDNLKAKINKVK